MRKIRLFSDYDVEVLQKKIDEWQTKAGVNILDVSVATSANFVGKFVAVVYDVNSPNRHECLPGRGGKASGSQK